MYRLALATTPQRSNRAIATSLDGCRPARSVEAVLRGSVSDPINVGDNNGRGLTLATPGHYRYWVGSREVMMVMPDCQPRNGMLYGLSSVGNPFQ